MTSRYGAAIQRAREGLDCVTDEEFLEWARIDHMLNPRAVRPADMRDRFCRDCTVEYREEMTLVNRCWRHRKENPEAAPKTIPLGALGFSMEFHDE